MTRHGIMIAIIIHINNGGLNEDSSDDVRRRLGQSSLDKVIKELNTSCFKGKEDKSGAAPRNSSESLVLTQGPVVR